MAQDSFNTIFRWVPVQPLQGGWYPSPEGDRCRAARFEAIFKPFVPSAVPARF
jgi:hypothetical protein